MNKELVKKNPRVWEYREDFLDSPASYAAFCVFRDMGLQRNLPAVAQGVKKNSSLIRRWSARCSWYERATAYDLHLDRHNLEAERKDSIQNHLSKIDKYRREHENLGWANLTIAASCLEICEKALSHIGGDFERIEKMKVMDIKNLVTAAQSSAEVGSQLLSTSLAVAKLLETMPIDVENVETVEFAEAEVV